MLQIDIQIEHPATEIVKQYNNSLIDRLQLLHTMYNVVNYHTFQLQQPVQHPVIQFQLTRLYNKHNICQL